MKILIVGLAKNPQLERIKEEGQKRGHQVDGCLSSELVIVSDPKSFKVSLQDKTLEDYDLIYLWTVVKRRWGWFTAVHFLNKKHSTIIVNQKSIDPSHLYYLSPAIDYLKQVENDLPFPKSAIIYSPRSLDSVIDRFGFPLILKTAGGRQGRGVFKIESKEELKKKMKELKEQSAFFVIREFIPNDGDIRIFTVGYKAIGAMKRTPAKKGEFRSNISLGGKGEKFDLEKYPKIQELSEKLSEITRTEIAGVDIMIHQKTAKPYILEINPGPQFTGLEKYTGTNAALEIVKYFEKLHNKGK